MAREHDDRRLETVLAQNAHGFAAIDVRESDIHYDEIDLPGFSGLDTFAAVFGDNSFEFFVQRQLFGQRIPQFRIVIDNENLTRIRHSMRTHPPLLARRSAREYKGRGY